MKSHRSLHVLVVDDSDDDAVLIRRALCRGGFWATCTRVATAEALAAALATDEHWDLITCDSGIARLSTAEVTAAARAALPDVPLLIVTGRHPFEVDASIADGFVSKEHLDELSPVVRAISLSAGARLRHR